MIHCIHPYRDDKNLGAAYNDTMRMCPDGDWVALMDSDAMFLTSNAQSHLSVYTRLHPNSLLTCYTNRLHPLGVDQLLNGVVNESDSMREHHALAEEQRKELYSVTEINHVISGFLMLVSKKMWLDIKFDESGKCLGVDNKFSKAVLDHPDYDIKRMNGIYIWHSYRLLQGIKDKTHLL